MDIFEFTILYIQYRNNKVLLDLLENQKGRVSIFNQSRRVDDCSCTNRRLY